MNISKECYDCGESFATPEHELESGYVHRKGEVVWVCSDCRDDDNTEEVDP